MSFSASSAAPTARRAAWQATVEALRRRAFVHDTLAALRRRGLAGREASLATEIALGAMRHVVTIDHVLSAVARFDPRRTPVESRAALYDAAYQVIWLERVPTFAAVDEAVGLVRDQVGRRASGMVNAVLRRLADALAQRGDRWRRLSPDLVRSDWARACRFKLDVLPRAESSDPAAPAAPADAAHLAAAAAEREPRFRLLFERFGPGAEAAAWASQAVPAIVLQRFAPRVSPEEFARRVRESFGVDADLTADAAFLPASQNAPQSALIGEGLAFVQDATARRAADLLEARAGERVLDLCAAPGGKSLAIASSMGDRGEVVACDVDEARLEHVRENLRRVGATCVQVRRLEGTPTGATSDAVADLAGACDAAIVDAPCSNSGVLARRPEARFTLTRARLDALTRLQAALLRRAAACVRPGGRLVYATCSIEPQENGAIVRALLAVGGDWRLEHEETTLPAWGPRPSDWRDGGYAALLRRR